MTDTSLDGRIALITGASRGIGAAVAKRLAAEGVHCILLARTTGALEEVDDAIQDAGGSTTLVPFDLNENHDALDQLGATIHERWGKLDILIGNAGQLGQLSPVAHGDPKLWNMVLNVNLTANFRLIRSMDPLLRLSDAGRAMFVTSGVAHSDAPYWGAYAASKAGLESMVRSYAAEMANTSIRANIIDPGVVRTAMRKQAFPGEDEMQHPEPERIVDIFLELASPNCTRNGDVVKANP